MKLLSPVNSLEAAKLQIKAGAEEIYVGMKTELYERYSFSGRGQKASNYKSIAPDSEDLRKITEYAHINSVQVSLAANVPMFSNYGCEVYEQYYIADILKAVGYGVDNVIVGDLGLLHKISKLNLPVNIHASTFFDTMSIEQLKFLKTFGVKRAVLSYHSHIDEITKLCQAKIMEIEVFGYLCCSFYNGACNLVHAMGEIGERDDVNIGVPCKAEYIVSCIGNEKELCAYLDADLACGLCAVKRLLEIGVDVVKIAGRDRDSEKIAQITVMFRRAIDIAKKSDMNFDEAIKAEISTWWKRIYCSKQKCKYMDNIVTQSYIGM